MQLWKSKAVVRNLFKRVSNNLLSIDWVCLMSAKGTLNTAIYRLEQFHRLNSVRVTIPIVTRKQSSEI
jgi:hypothetical protein